MSGYFTGYAFKGQPGGKHALQLVDKSFEFLRRTLQETSAENRFRKTAVRTMVTFQNSTSSRPSTEEALLSMCVHDSDEQCWIRLYVNQELWGSCLLRVLERTSRQPDDDEELHATCVPKICEDLEPILLKHFDALYGLRPRAEEIFYLNVWGFLCGGKFSPLEKFSAPRMHTNWVLPEVPGDFLLR